jgi:dTDP-4-dehydrorhamnose 3,5-epimerase/CDP-3, 6-dideoxy-D-glycero-D-glycero-4-hexulose-5-epimerase
MNKFQEILPGTFHVQLDIAHDYRGKFVKTFSDNIFNFSSFKLKEEFYSLSNKDVIRGMHFQIPPFDHDKIIYCSLGSALDVLLDLRSGKGYGQFRSLILDNQKPSLIYIPKGIAHGFKALTDNTMMIYKTNSSYSPQHDVGTHYDSFNFDWGCISPILSERDKAHQNFNQFKTPF